MIFFKVTRLRNDTDRIRDGIVQIFLQNKTTNRV